MWAQRPRSGAQVRAEDVSRLSLVLLWAPGPLRCHFASAHPDDMASGGGALKVTEPSDKSGAAAAAKVRRAKASFPALRTGAAADGRSDAVAGHASGQAAEVRNLAVDRRQRS